MPPSLRRRLPLYPTASTLQLALACLAPWALGLPLQEDEGDQWSERGRRLHAIAEELARCQASRHAHARAEDNAFELLLHEAIRADVAKALPGGPWLTEQGIKWRPGPLAPEVERCDRRPGERIEGWFSGTADLVYVRDDGVLVVIDWKFGPQEKWLGEPAKESCQGWLLAVAFADLLGVRGSPDPIVARFERRMVSESGIEVDGFDIAQRELDAFAVDLSILAERIDGAVGALPEINHGCGRCKARSACPTWGALEENVAVQLAGLLGAAIAGEAPQTAEDCAGLHHAITAGKVVLDRWEQYRKAWCILNPEGAPIGPGVVVRAVPNSKRQVTKTPEAIALIEETVGPDALQKSATIKAIDRAARTGACVDGIASKTDRDRKRREAAEEAFTKLIAKGAVIEKGASWSVKPCRGDGTSIEAAEENDDE